MEICFINTNRVNDDNPHQLITGNYAGINHNHHPLHYGQSAELYLAYQARDDIHPLLHQLQGQLVNTETEMCLIAASNNFSTYLQRTTIISCKEDRHLSNLCTVEEGHKHDPVQHNIQMIAHHPTLTQHGQQQSCESLENMATSVKSREASHQENEATPEGLEHSLGEIAVKRASRLTTSGTVAGAHSAI